MIKSGTNLQGEQVLVSKPLFHLFSLIFCSLTHFLLQTSDQQKLLKALTKKHQERGYWPEGSLVQGTHWERGGGTKTES